MVGMKVVVIKCDEHGNVDIEDLKEKAKTHSENLAALMVTYPSTHGVLKKKFLKYVNSFMKMVGKFTWTALI